MTFDAFDVVVVPFPFTDRQAAKRRPALIVRKIGTLSKRDGRAVRNSLSRYLETG